MSITHETTYTCDDDCVPSGCPGHKASLSNNQITGTFAFKFGDVEFVLDTNQFDAMKELIQKEISKDQYDLFLVNNNVFVKGVQEYFNIQNRGYKYVCYMNKEQLKIFNIC